MDSITRKELKDFCIAKAKQYSDEADSNYNIMVDKTRKLTDDQYEALHIAHSTAIGKQMAFREILENFGWNQADRTEDFKPLTEQDLENWFRDYNEDSAGTGDYLMLAKDMTEEFEIRGKVE